MTRISRERGFVYINTIDRSTRRPGISQAFLAENLCPFLLMATHSSERVEKASMKEEVKEVACAGDPGAHHPNLQLDTGQEYVRFRQRPWQLW